MKSIQHKSFVGPTFYWNFKGLDKNREKIRKRAEAFIGQIGVDNVVSITEHAMTLGPFSVVVWYRVDETNKAEP